MLEKIANARVVRLNAELMPVSDTERRLYNRYGLSPTEVEAADPEDIIPHVQTADAICIVSASLPVEVIDRLDSCRLISRLGNGTDKIDVDRATERGIVVSNVPTFCLEEMADHVMALVLSFSRDIPRMSERMLKGSYRRARAEGVRLRRLSGQVLGLVGFGATAIAVAERARPFGLKVIATRRNMEGPHPEAEALGVKMISLPELLKRSDYVSLHLPLTSETHHLLHRENLTRMKPGSFLINTSRGAIVDEDALAELLGERHLAGAGLDTFDVIEIFGETEKAPRHPLTKLDNVILTPHVSGLSVEAIDDIGITAVENLVSVLGGHLPNPENIVNIGVDPRSPLRPYEPTLFEA